MQKMIILVTFCYFQGLGACLESKEETSNFKRCSILCIPSTEKKIEGIMFSLKSLKCTRKCKK